MSNVLRNRQTVFQSAGTILHYHWQCRRVPVPLHCICDCIFDYSPPGGYEVVAHCGFHLYFHSDQWCRIFLPVPIGHSLTCFGGMCTQSFAPFLIVCIFLLLSFALFIYSGYKSSIGHKILKYFLLPCELFSLHYFNAFWSTKNFNFDEVQDIDFFSFMDLLLVSYLRNLCLTQSIYYLLSYISFYI